MPPQALTIDAYLLDDHPRSSSAVVQGRQPGKRLRDRSRLPERAIRGATGLMPLLWRGRQRLAPLPFHVLSLLFRRGHGGLRVRGPQAVASLHCSAPPLVFGVHATHAEAVGANVHMPTAVGRARLGRARAVRRRAWAGTVPAWPRSADRILVRNRVVLRARDRGAGAAPDSPRTSTVFRRSCSSRWR
jgi:hypothetical protein